MEPNIVHETEADVTKIENINAESEFQTFDDHSSDAELSTSRMLEFVEVQYMDVAETDECDKQLIICDSVKLSKSK